MKRRFSIFKIVCLIGIATSFHAVARNAARSLQQLFEHVSSDDLVGWRWDPGQGRTLPPLSRPETSAQLRIWIEGGAVCPE